MIKRSIQICSLLAVLGCDELPQPKIIAVPVADGVVTREGRGDYDWSLVGDRFATQRPTSFLFVDEIDLDKVRNNWRTPKYAEPDSFTKPDGMDDDVYRWFRRFTDPNPAPKLIKELDASKEVDTTCVAINLNGTRLVTLGQKLIEWNIEAVDWDSKLESNDTATLAPIRIREFQSPISNAVSVYYDASQDSVLVRTVNELFRVSLANGAIVGSWKLPQGKIQTLAIARDTDAQAVLSDDFQLYALSNNFGESHLFRHNQITGKSIDIHPMGLWIIGTADRSMIRWRLDLDGQPIEKMPLTEADYGELMATCGTHFDRWVGLIAIHEYQGSQETMPYRAHSLGLYVNPRVYDSMNATIDGSQDWLIVMASAIDRESKIVRFVQDIDLGRLDYSPRWLIPEDKYVQVWANSSAERLVFLVDKKLRIYARRRWVDLFGRATAEGIGSLLMDGRIEQMELCTRELCEKPYLRNLQSGRDYLYTVAESIGVVWKYLESQPASSETMAAIESWRIKGSELAILASAERHEAIAREARGTGYTDSVSKENWKIYNERTSMARAELARLPNHERPSIRDMMDNRPQLEKWLKRTIELNPNDTETFVAVCNYLLPRWGGEIGEGGALISAIASRLPKPVSSIFYSRVAIGLSRMHPIETVQRESGIKPVRVLDGADAIISSGTATRSEIEILLAFALHAGKKTLAERLARYHVDHFDVPTNYAHRTGVIQALYTARITGIRSAEKK